MSTYVFIPLIIIFIVFVARETLLPEQVEEIGHMIPNSVPPQSSVDINKRLEPLKKRKSFKSEHDCLLI